MPADPPNRPVDRPPPTFPYNKLSEADTKLVLDRASSGDAAARSEKRASAETNRALNDAVKAQQTALMGAVGQASTSTPGGTSSSSAVGGAARSALDSSTAGLTPGGSGQMKSWYERSREETRKGKL